jgi:streptogramin lyase
MHVSCMLLSGSEQGRIPLMIRSQCFFGSRFYRGLGVAALVVGFAVSQSDSFKRIENVAGLGMPGLNGNGGNAESALINNPFGLTRGPDGCLYFCDTGNHCVRRVSSSGIIEMVAGTGESGYSGDEGPALEAELFEPYELRFDRNGDLFFVEMRNHIIRKVSMDTGVITTVVGTGEAGYSGDGGVAVLAKLNRPHSIQFGPMGALYICDIGNHRIRKVDLVRGNIATFAGTGDKKTTADGGSIVGMPLNGPRAMDFDGDGNMWLALREGNQVYRIDMTAETIHHVAGTGEKGFSGNGGPAKLAKLSGPKGISIGPQGNVYLADTESHSVRMIDLETGHLELIAGDGVRGDGPYGNPEKCRFSRLHGIFVDIDGAIYVGDSEAHRIRRIVN